MATIVYIEHFLFSINKSKITVYWEDKFLHTRDSGDWSLSILSTKRKIGRVMCVSKWNCFRLRQYLSQHAKTIIIVKMSNISADDPDAVNYYCQQKMKHFKNETCELLFQHMEAVLSLKPTTLRLLHVLFKYGMWYDRFSNSI